MNFKLLLLSTLVAFSSSSCTPSKVDAGEEGVMIMKPYIFGSGGVSNDVINTGLTWTALSTTVYRYNIKPVKYTEQFVDLTASDNVAIDFNVYLTLRIEKGSTPKLHEESGKDWYHNKVKDYFRTVVRNAGRVQTSIAWRTDPKIISESQQTIHDLMVAYFKKIELKVFVEKVVIGKVNPPDGVLKESERTASQTQRQKTQAARAIAERSRAKAETETARADKAFATEFKMSTEQYLKNKELDIMSKAITAGNPVTIIMNSSNATPIFNTGK